MPDEAPVMKTPKPGSDSGHTIGVIDEAPGNWRLTLISRRTGV